MAKFCGICGAKLDEQTGQCPNCARRQQNSLTGGQPAASPQMGRTPAYTPPPREKKEIEKTKRTSARTVKTIVAVILSVLLIAGLVAALIYSGFVQIPIRFGSGDLPGESEESSFYTENLEAVDSDRVSALESRPYREIEVDRNTESSVAAVPPMSPSSEESAFSSTPSPADDFSAEESAYILPQSSSRLLTHNDIAGLGEQDLMLARNEIYARHGRKFSDNDVRTYFEAQSWYQGTIDPTDFSESVFSDIEKKNIEYLKEAENKLTGSASPESDYMIPASSSRRLTESDFAGLSNRQLELARNEIYARHGRKFHSQDLQEYFNSKSWYRGRYEPEEFSETLLSEIEKYNIELIKAHE